MTVQEGGTEYSLSSFQPSKQHIVQEGGTEARYCVEFNSIHLVQSGRNSIVAQLQPV